MSPASEMSRAIRKQLQRYAQRLSDLPDDVLTESRDILGAFYMDLQEECRKRGLREIDERRREMKRSG